MAKFEIEVGFTGTGGNEPDKLIGILERLEKQAKGLKLDLFKAEDLNAMKQAGNSLASVQNEIKSYINEAVKMSAANKAVAGSYDEAQQNLTQLGRSIKSAKDGFTSTDPVILAQINQYQALNDKLKAFDTTLGNSHRRIGDYASAFRGANGVSTEFNRIIQDAPFGIIGVGNNIQQLTANYAQYAAQVKIAYAEQGKTATSTDILKGAVSSILSPVSLLSLGVSLATSAWTFYTMWSQKASKADEEKKKTTDDARKALDEYVKSLNASQRAQINGTISAQKEGIELKLLYQASQNILLPMNERIKAAKQLQEQYPDTFKNFTAEEIALGKVSKGYQQLQSDIVAVAKAAARIDIITELSKENTQLEIRNKGLDAQIKKEEAAFKIQKERSDLQQKTNAARFNSDGLITDTGRDAVLAAIDLQKTTAERDKNVANIAKNTKIISGLEKEINQTSVARKSVTNVTGIDAGKEDKTGKKLKSLSDILAELKIDLDQTATEFGLTFDEQKAKNIDDYQKAIKSLIDNGFNKASDAVKNLQKVQNELFDNLKKRGGNLENIGASLSVFDTIKDGDLIRKNRSASPSKLNTAEKNVTIPKLAMDWSAQIDGALQRTADNFLFSLENIGAKGKGVFLELGTSFTNTFNELFRNQLTNAFKDFVNGARVDLKELGLAATGVLGTIISGLGVSGKKGNGAAKTIGGALSGAASGALIAGPIGAAIGGLIGGLSGLFGAKKAKKEAQLQEQQLAEEKKQTALMERTNALAYAASIIGRQTINGVVTGVEVNEFGQLTTKIAGQDLAIVLDRANRSRKRGT